MHIVTYRICVLVINAHSLLLFEHGSRLDWKTGETWKMGEHFPVMEKLTKFDQTGKVKEFSPTYQLENREFGHRKIGGNTGKI